MNPLGLPKWKSRAQIADPPKAPPSFGEGNVVTGLPDSEDKKRAPLPFISKKEEHTREAAKAQHTIEVRVAADRSKPAESVKLAWSKGKSLGEYLSPIGLKMAAVRRAVYDMTNLGRGRLRLYYEPEPGAIIQIQDAAIGVQYHLQTNKGRDLQRMALNMGAEKGSPPPKFVDYTMTYNPAPKPKEEDEDEHCGVPQV